MGVLENTNDIESTDKVTTEKDFFVMHNLRASQPDAEEFYYSLSVWSHGLSLLLPIPASLMLNWTIIKLQEDVFKKSVRRIPSDK